MATADQVDMRITRALCAAATLLFGGCLEFEQTVTIAADGSGTQHVRLALREATLAELERASSAAHAGGGADPKAIFDERLVGKELRAAGLELGAYEATRDGGRRTVDVTATFGDFATLQKSPLCGSSAQWVLEAGPRPGTTRLTLYPQGRTAWIEARERAAKMGDEIDPVTAEFFAKRRAQLAGLDVLVRFRLPGDVLVWTANMEKTGEREVTARVTAAQLATPQELVRRLAPRFEVIFDSSGTSLAAR